MSSPCFIGTVYTDIVERNNGSARLCTAEMKVSRLNKVAAEWLLTTILCFFFMSGRCGQANCKYAHGPRELKHAPDLKKTKLCFEFSEECCQEVPRVPLLIGMKICAPPQAFSRLGHATSSNEFLQEKSALQTHAWCRGVVMLTHHPLWSPRSEPQVHRSLLLADLRPEDRIGVEGQSLPTDHACAF